MQSRITFDTQLKITLTNKYCIYTVKPLNRQGHLGDKKVVAMERWLLLWPGR